MYAHISIVKNSKPSIFKYLLNKLILYSMKIIRHLRKIFKNQKQKGEKNLNHHSTIQN